MASLKDFYRSAKIEKNLVFLSVFCLAALILMSVAQRSSSAQQADFPPADAKRIVFLGDSITHAGDFIAMVEAQWLLDGKQFEVLNLGLPSETCTGLSEPAHPFPRPDVHERLKRCLEKSDPDVIVACYGMNDGIYHPFSQERFQKFKDGIGKLIRIAKENDVELVLMTPPPFDPLPFKKKGKLVVKDAGTFAWFSIYENYDVEVMKVYSDWLLKIDDKVRVINLREPILKFMADKRKTDPDFVMSGDGVHINEDGHALLARTALKAWGYQPKFEASSKLVKSIKARQVILRDAWLTHVGHKRPKMKKGLPLDEANKKVQPLNESIQKAVGN